MKAIATADSAADAKVRRTLQISPQRWDAYNPGNAVSALSASAYSDDPDKAEAIDIANQADETLQGIDPEYKPVIAQKVTEIFDAGGTVQDALQMIRDFIKKVSSVAPDETPEDADVRKRLSIGLQSLRDQGTPTEASKSDPVSALSVGGQSAADVEVQRVMGISRARWDRYNSSPALSPLSAASTRRIFEIETPRMTRIERRVWP